MTAAVITFRQNVEEEGFDIIVERLVVEEELGEEAEILTVNLLLLAVDLTRIIQ